MKIPVILAMVGMLAFRETGYGLGTEQIGPDPSTVPQPGWPKGIVEVLRHPSRVYSDWVNGNENFYFKATAAEINELLDLFSKARMRDYEIWIQPGANAVKSFRGAAYEYNVSLQVLSGIALAVLREKDPQETLESRLTIQAGDDRSLLKQLKLPANAVVRCEVEGVEIKARLTKPNRRVWYGRVQFDDSSPAADFKHGVSTSITLWEKELPDGIQLAIVSYQGFFNAAFSDREIADLEKGKNWLTMTVGNYLTEAKKDDPRFPAEMLAREKEKAEPRQIGRPIYYYGRILFADGSPAILDPKPWPGAELRVDFPYAGSANLDAQGYLKVFFGPEQFEQVKSQKPRKNIYCPTQEQGTSVAGEVFPAELLSPDKTKAGVVRVSKPIYQPRIDLEKAPSLIGKPLPPLQDLKVELSPTALSNRMILVCFFDLQQRPSRNCVAELAKEAEDLRGKGVFLVAVQASAVDKNVLERFARTNHLAFPVGIIQAEEEKTKFNWGLKSQPWLILTDKEHIVRAEGFAPGELNDKLR